MTSTTITLRATCYRLVRCTALLAVLTAAAACSSDDTPTAPACQDVVLHADMRDGDTRATLANTWTQGDLVAVDFGGTVKQYHVVSETGTLKGIDAANTHHWDITNTDAVSIRAWAMGSSAKYLAAFPEAITIDDDQSDADKLQAQDFLMAPARNIAHADEPHTLTFYHQLAQVIFRIKLADPESGMTAISGATIGTTANPVRLNGTFTPPTGNATYGTWAFGSTTGVITPCETTPSYGFSKAYTAVVIPGTYAVGTPLLTLTATEGDYTYLVAGSALTLATGGSYTFDVTVENHSIIVRLAGSIIGWGQVGRNIQVQPSNSF